MDYVFDAKLVHVMEFVFSALRERRLLARMFALMVPALASPLECHRCSPVKFTSPPPPQPSPWTLCYPVGESQDRVPMPSAFALGLGIRSPNHHTTHQLTYLDVTGGPHVVGRGAFLLQTRGACVVCKVSVVGPPGVLVYSY